MLTINQIAASDEDVYDDSDRDIIRAKWVMDGAQDLFEAALKLTAHARMLLELHDQGWRLQGPVTDDYGFIKRCAKPTSCEEIQWQEVWLV